MLTSAEFTPPGLDIQACIAAVEGYLAEIAAVLELVDVPAQRLTPERLAAAQARLMRLLARLETDYALRSGAGERAMTGVERACFYPALHEVATNGRPAPDEVELAPWVVEALEAFESQLMLLLAFVEARG